MTAGMSAVCNYAIMQLANREVHSKSISSCCTGFAATKPKREELTTVVPAVFGCCQGVNKMLFPRYRHIINCHIT